MISSFQKISLMLAAGAVLGSACSNGSGNGDGGTTGAETTGSTTGSNATTSGGSTGGSNGGSTSGTTTSLYAKYGGAPTVKAVVAAAETGLLNDCVTAPYFQGVVHPVAGSGYETVDNLTGCLNLFFAAALGGPAHYPGVNEAEYTSAGAPILGYVAANGDGGWNFDADGGTGAVYNCASMRDAHSNHAANPDLGITPEAFDEFVKDVGGVLSTAGVSSADVTTIAGAVTGFKDEVVSYYPQVAYSCLPDSGYAPTDAGTTFPPGSTVTETLWTKYGGGPTIAAAVSGAETKLTTDCVTSPYFYGVLHQDAGYESLGNLSACLNLFFSAAFGGPAVYPGVNAPEMDGGNEVYGYITEGNPGEVGGMGYYFNTSNTALNGSASANTYNCEPMFQAHNAYSDGGGNPELGITHLAFTEFVTDVAGVLTSAGVSSTDVTALGGALDSFETKVVAPTPAQEITYSGVCDGGLPGNAVDGGN